ncbi:hypothetical protein [Stieleria varia]|uniref:Uncharacterized protein n=1 Tax=Stieleria varia TaxID=2528005 RepID=A0A5C6A3M8_9BACT|nr:hypothetical protein [Stieleria varia]TWT93990.1 hypothetical protein Pla52n_58190 [Stieleria varia]
MAASNRAKLITKLHTELKKRYDVSPTQPSRPLLEHLLYACLLEDCPQDLADEGLAKCEQDFYDWNEVRVTTVSELSQVLGNLPEPAKSAKRLKDNLQSVFEEFYNFDIDSLKKENLGKAVAKFEAMPSMTPFVLNYTIQHGLGGHAVPIDYSAMVIMLATGIASQPEAATGKVPGIERAIPKNKGVEFADLLHQAGVALKADSNDKKARQLLDAVVKGASDQMDEWFASKKAAIRRIRKRRKDEAAAAEAAAEQAAIDAEAVASAKAERAAKKAAKTSKTTSSASASKSDTSKTTKSSSSGKQAASDSTKTTSSKSSSTKGSSTQPDSEKSKSSTASKSTASGSTSKKKVSSSKTSSTSESTKKKSTAKKSTASKSSADSSAKSTGSKKKSSTTKKSAKTSGAATPAPTKKTSATASKKTSSRKLSKRKPR